MTTPNEKMTVTHEITASYLQEFTETATSLVDEAKIHTSRDGWTSTATEPGNVAMYNLNLPSTAFETIEDGMGTIGVNLSRFDDVLKFADSDETITLQYDERTRKLTLGISGLEYTLALIDPDSIRQEPDLSDLDLPVSVKLNERQLDRAVKAADTLTDQLKLRANKDDRVLEVYASGDTDDVDILWSEDDDEVTFEQLDGSVAARYSLDYLKDVRDGIPTGHEVRITLGNEYPVTLTFALGDGIGKGEYMIAPRLQK